jgi:hypothetical protein
LAFGWCFRFGFRVGGHGGRGTGNAGAESASFLDGAQTKASSGASWRPISSF